MLKSRLLRSILTAAAAGVLLGVSAGPASSAVDRHFDVYTSMVNTPGRAHVNGTVRFLSGGSVRITGYINDICPADGYGARVYFRGRRGPTYAFAKDRRGCEYRRAIPFSHTYSRGPSDPGRIDEVYIRLQELDAPTKPSVGNGTLGDVKTVRVTRR